MKIKFLKYCQAPQEKTEIRCSCCGPVPVGEEMTNFYAGDEEDPEEFWHKIDLRNLTYRVDYDIIEYP